MMGEASVMTRKRCSLSRNARSACFCAEISRATFEAPITRPEESLTGEMVTETSRRLPSFRLRTVWKWSMRSPRRKRSRMSDSSACRSGGMIRVLADNGIVGGGYNGSQQTRYFFCLLPLAHILIVVTTQPPYLLGCPRTPGEALDQSAHFHLTNGKVFRRHVSPLAALARTALHASHSDQ